MAETDLQLLPVEPEGEIVVSEGEDGEVFQLEVDSELLGCLGPD